MPRTQQEIDRYQACLSEIAKGRPQEEQKALLAVCAWLLGVSQTPPQSSQFVDAVQLRGLFPTSSGELCSAIHGEGIEMLARALGLASSSENRIGPINQTTERIACPWCGSTDTKSSGLFGSSGFDIVECLSCELLYLRTRFNTAGMEAMYRDYIQDTLPRNTEEIQKSGFLRTHFLDELLEFTNPKGRLLDVGCAWGGFLYSARARGFDPVGVEVTARNAHYAVQQLGLDVRNCQLENAGLEDNFFNAVTMIHSMEHLPAPRAAVSKVLSALKPGGIFGGIVPNGDSFLAREKKEKWIWLDPHFHYVHYTPKTLRNVLLGSGFKLMRMYTTAGDGFTNDLRNEVKSYYGCSTPLKVEETIEALNKAGLGEEIRFFAIKPA